MFFHCLGARHLRERKDYARVLVRVGVAFGEELGVRGDEDGLEAGDGDEGLSLHVDNGGCC